jgi:glycosyltransferase involved in cell wall biosynthesis
MPLFSIITVCLNESNRIKQCVDSVLNQNFKDYEYIVIDGKSTDGTVEFLKSISNRLTYFESSADSGIYNAMNKALHRVNGEYIYFLNANDCFHDNQVLQDASEALKFDQEIDVLHGKLLFTENNSPAEYKDNVVFEFEGINDFYTKNLPQQCFFFKKSLFKKIGFFNEKYTICADYDFTTKAIIKKCNFHFINRVFCDFDTTGISGMQPKKRIRQKRKIIITNSPTSVLIKYVLLGLLSLIQSKKT